MLPYFIGGVRSETVIFPPGAQQLPASITQTLQVASDPTHRAQAVICVVNAEDLQGARRPDGYYEVEERFNHYAEIVQVVLTHLKSRPFLVVTKMDQVNLKPESVVRYFCSLGFDLNGIVMTTLYHRSVNSIEAMPRSSSKEAPILRILASIVAKVKSGTHHDVNAN
jgi:hypothetical protein